MPCNVPITAMLQLYNSNYKIGLRPSPPCTTVPKNGRSLGVIHLCWFLFELWSHTAQKGNSTDHDHVNFFFLTTLPIFQH